MFLEFFYEILEFKIKIPFLNKNSNYKKKRIIAKNKLFTKIYIFTKFPFF